MATFFSGVTIGWWNTSSNYLYGTLTGDVSRSGNKVTLSNLKLAITVRYNNSYGSDNNWNFTVGGVRSAVPLRITSGSYNVGTFSLNDVTFDVAESQTSASVNWSSSDGNSGSFQVSFPSGATAPTGLSLSNIVPGIDNFRGTVSVAGWGSGGSESGRYLRLSVCSSQSTSNRRYATHTGSDLSATLDVTNESAGNITLAPNTQYYLTMSASNGAASTGSSSFQTATTLPPQATLSVVEASDNAATIQYACPADGGRYAKSIEYSLDGGKTWATGATVSTGTATTGTFQISGLVSGTSYTLLSRVSTDAGETGNATITFTTAGGTPAIAMLASVENSAARIIKFYGSLSEKSRLVEKFYASVDGKSALVN